MLSATQSQQSPFRQTHTHTHAWTIALLGLPSLRARMCAQAEASSLLQPGNEVDGQVVAAVHLPFRLTCKNKVFLTTRLLAHGALDLLNCHLLVWLTESPNMGHDMTLPTFLPPKPSDRAAARTSTTRGTRCRCARQTALTELSFEPSHRHVKTPRRL